MILLVLAVPSAARGEGSLFFFYSPDFGPGNLSGLTAAAESYFVEAKTDVGFQPFARIEDFEHEFARRKPQFIVAPERIVLARCVGSRLLPLAHPVRDGKGFGQRSLMAGPGVDTAAKLKNGSVAATLPTSGDTGLSTAVIQLQRDLPDVRIIPVPKDIDALLAVGFGQVDAAFVSNAQFTQLAKINPKLTKDLRELGYTEQIPFPMVYATEFATPDDVEKLRSLMHTVNETVSGQRLTALLGYDDWIPVDPAAATPLTVPARCREMQNPKEGSS